MKRRAGKRGKFVTTRSQCRCVIRGGEGVCEEKRGREEAAHLYFVFTWARWYVSDMTICETRNPCWTLMKTGNWPIAILNPGVSWNLMMSRCNSSIASEMLTNSQQPFPTPRGSSHSHGPLYYHLSCCSLAHGPTGVFHKPWGKWEGFR